MSDWKYEINDGLVAFYENGIERDIDKVFDTLNAAESRIAELEDELKAGDEGYAYWLVDSNNEIRQLKSRIAELEVFIDQLIEAGTMLAECSEFEGGKIAWDELVYYWEEG